MDDLIEIQGVGLDFVISKTNQKDTNDQEALPFKITFFPSDEQNFDYITPTEAKLIVKFLKYHLKQKR